MAASAEASGTLSSAVEPGIRGEVWIASPGGSNTAGGRPYRRVVMARSIDRSGGGHDRHVVQQGAETAQGLVAEPGMIAHGQGGHRLVEAVGAVGDPGLDLGAAVADHGVDPF